MLPGCARRISQMNSATSSTVGPKLRATRYATHRSRGGPANPRQSNSAEQRYGTSKKVPEAVTAAE